MTTITERFDPAVSEAFAGRMVEVLNSASLALMTSIGHQVGLFDALAGQPPATSEQIAQWAGLDERYVREWLSALAAGRMITYDPAGRTYQLPSEHAAWLTRAARATDADTGPIPTPPFLVPPRTAGSAGHIDLRF